MNRFQRLLLQEDTDSRKTVIHISLKWQSPRIYTDTGVNLSLVIASYNVRLDLSRHLATPLSIGAFLYPVSLPFNLRSSACQYVTFFLSRNDHSCCSFTELTINQTHKKLKRTWSLRWLSVEGTLSPLPALSLYKQDSTQPLHVLDTCNPCDVSYKPPQWGTADV